MSDVREMPTIALPVDRPRPNIRPAAIVAGATLIVLIYSLPYIYLLLTSLKPANDVLQIQNIIVLLLGAQWGRDRRDQWPHRFVVHALSRH